jgi:hypothetical protein
MMIENGEPVAITSYLEDGEWGRSSTGEPRDAENTVAAPLPSSHRTLGDRGACDVASGDEDASMPTSDMMSSLSRTGSYTIATARPSACSRPPT